MSLEENKALVRRFNKEALTTAISVLENDI